ncbi:MAG TPA: hypothetical protein VEQ40_12165 [Pyrinomonadaceae bacterium]|nr:hypothetical protein [Pyrinomonadaceae bacterium]
MLEKLTERDIEEMIDKLFNDMPELAEARVESNKGTALHFGFDTSAGVVNFIYPLPPAIRRLHQMEYATKEATSYLLAETVKALRPCLFVAMEKARTIADVIFVEDFEAVASTRKTRPRPYDAKQIAADRANAHKRFREMDERVFPPPTSKKGERIPLKRIQTAIVDLSTSLTAEQITSGLVARRLKCNAGALRNICLRKAKMSFEELRGKVLSNRGASN